MKKLCRVGCILLGAALLLVALFALYGKTDALSRVQKAGRIVIGYAVEAPYAFVDKNGRVTGEGPEIARQVATALKIPQIEWRQIEFAHLLDELEAERIDVVAAGLFITPERARRVLFSQPTLLVRPALLVAGGNPKKLYTYRQAIEQKVRIAVLAGAVDESNLQRLGASANLVVRVPDALTGRRAVETGLADALMLSEPTLRWMARRDQLGQTEMIVVSEPENVDDDYGRPAFAFRLRDKALKTAWDEKLHVYLGSQAHRELMQRLGLRDKTAAGVGEKS